MFLQTFIGMIIVILWLLVLGRVLMSWVDPTGRTQVGGFLIQATEPILAPVRRIMPPTGMFDFSSFIVLVILGVLMRVVL
jgi:YggT family protein